MVKGNIKMKYVQIRLKDGISRSWCRRNRKHKSWIHLIYFVKFTFWSYALIDWQLIYIYNVPKLNSNGSIFLSIFLAYILDEPQFSVNESTCQQAAYTSLTNLLKINSTSFHEDIYKKKTLIWYFRPYSSNNLKTCICNWIL